LAAVTMMQGNAAMALEYIWRSLQIAETQKSRSLFVDIVKKRLERATMEKFGLPSAGLDRAMARPSELAQIAADLVKREPEIGACVARAARAWPKPLSAQELFGAMDPGALSADPVLAAC